MVVFIYSSIHILLILASTTAVMEPKQSQFQGMGRPIAPEIKPNASEDKQIGIQFNSQPSPPDSLQSYIFNHKTEPFVKQQCLNFDNQDKQIQIQDQPNQKHSKNQVQKIQIAESQFLLALSKLSLQGQLNMEFTSAILPKIAQILLKVDQQALLDEKFKLVRKNLLSLYTQLNFKWLQLKPKIKQQFKLQDCDQDHIPQLQQHYNQPFIIDKQQKKQYSINNKKRKRAVYQSTHLRFLKYLDYSMKKLKIYDQIRLICLQKNVWPIRLSVVNFIKKLIAIKIIFPGYFEPIVLQFIQIIKNFNPSEPQNQAQTSARDQISRQYISCVLIYNQSNNIKQAAEKLYEFTPKCKMIQDRIQSFEEYQNQMYSKAQTHLAQRRLDSQSNQCSKAASTQPKKKSNRKPKKSTPKHDIQNNQNPQKLEVCKISRPLEEYDKRWENPIQQLQQKPVSLEEKREIQSWQNQIQLQSIVSQQISFNFFDL